jgi:hypothetical protein
VEIPPKTLKMPTEAGHRLYVKGRHLSYQRGRRNTPSSRISTGDNTGRASLRKLQRSGPAVPSSRSEPLLVLPRMHVSCCAHGDVHGIHDYDLANLQPRGQGTGKACDKWGERCVGWSGEGSIRRRSTRSTRYLRAFLHEGIIKTIRL